MEFDFKPILLLYIVIQFWILGRKEGAKKKFISLFVFTAFCEIFLGLGYVVKLGEFEINYSYLSMIITFLWGLILNIKGFIKINFKYIILMTLILLVGIGIRVVSPVKLMSLDHTITVDNLFNGVSKLIPLSITSYSWITLVKIEIVMFSLMCLVQCFDYTRFKVTINRYKFFFKIYISFALLEYIVNNLVDPTLIRQAVFNIFGTSSTAIQVPYFRVGLYSILLTCREPSLACYALMFCSLGLYFIDNYVKREKSNQIFMAVSIVCMVLSFALTGILFSLIFIMMILIKRNVQNMKSIIRNALILLIAVIFFVFIFINTSSEFSQYVLGRLNNVSNVMSYMFDKDRSINFRILGGTSEVVRFYSMINNIGVLLRTPLFGAGIGTATSNSGWIATLANIGIFGAVCWISMIRYIIRKIGIREIIKPIILCVLMFLPQGGLTDILCSYYYFLWLILFALILNFKRTELLTNSEIIRGSDNGNGHEIYNSSLFKYR